MFNSFKKICDTYNEVDLTDYNTYKLSSKAKYMVFPKDSDELFKVIDIINKNHIKYLVLGNGSNVILPEYYDGVIIKLDKLNKCIINDEEIYVECGYKLNKLATEVSEKGLSGLEWATGIPGTIGGSIYNNAGAYNSSMSVYLKDVVVFDGKEIKQMDNSELDFKYRDSIFKKNKNLIILSCNLKLEKGNVEQIKALIKDRTQRRIETQDLSHPSCGSVFRNPEGLSAGKLIDDLKLKGFSIGGAKVSTIHANFIINDGGATAKDIKLLIDKIKKDVKKFYKIDLTLEQEIIK